MFKTKLKELNACQGAIDWVGDKTFEEAYASCHRGDWMLWLFVKSNPDKIRERVLVAGHCANTVRHLMTDPRSLAAVDAAIAFGEGKIEREALEEAAWAAAAAARAAWAAAADAAARAAWAAAADAAAARAAAVAAAVAAAAARAAVAASADADAADAAAAVAAAAAAWDAAADAKLDNQNQTADIVRQYLPIEIWRKP